MARLTKGAALMHAIEQGSPEPTNERQAAELGRSDKAQHTRGYRKLKNGWTISCVSVPFLESDSDGCFQSGRTCGLKIVTDRGVILADGRTGISGSREGIEKWISSLDDSTEAPQEIETLAKELEWIVNNGSVGPRTRAFLLENFNLIASAPSLLDACTALLTWVESAPTTESDRFAALQAIRTARAAIARAEGAL